MNLSSTECEERNAHMTNTPAFAVGVLRERNGVAREVQLVGRAQSPWSGTFIYDFEAPDGTVYTHTDNNSYWDFTDKETI